jgi:hypothetical protein
MTGGYQEVNPNNGYEKAGGLIVALVSPSVRQKDLTCNNERPEPSRGIIGCPGKGPNQ